MGGRREHRLADVELFGVVLGMTEASIVSWVVAGAVLLVVRLLRKRHDRRAPRR